MIAMDASTRRIGGATICIDPARRLATVCLPATTDLITSVRVLRALVFDPAFGPGLGVIWDLRAVQHVPRLDVQQGLGRLLASEPLLQHCPVALVVSPPAGAHYARTVATFARAWGGRVAVVTTESAAEAWLIEALGPR